MSTRQRFSHETTAETMTPAPLLLARSMDAEPQPAEDIGARRLRELARRFSQGGIPTSDDDDGTLDGTDVEFEPVSLASILALGREQQPDTPGSSLIEADGASSPVVPFVAISSAPLPAPEAANDAAPTTTTLPALASVAPVEPLRFAAEEVGPPVEAAIAEADEIDETNEEALETAVVSIVEPISEQDATAAVNQPLMLADQSEPDVRLVDLIRRQQTLLDQLNSFPPSYDASQHAEEQAPAPRTLIEQLAPHPTPETAASEPEPAREAPPPLPSPAPERAPPTLTLSPPTRAARERMDEPNASELTQNSPMIIQRARAERSGRRIPVVATPPSAVPAFLGGLAAALLVAGVLLAIL
jgi:hypothetical protein